MTNRDPLNKDPITDEAGSHPIGTGLGAGGGALAGVALGAVGGPIGMAAGAVVGAVMGGLAGHGTAEVINPTEVDLTPGDTALLPADGAPTRPESKS